MHADAHPSTETPDPNNSTEKVCTETDSQTDSQTDRQTDSSNPSAAVINAPTGPLKPLPGETDRCTSGAELGKFWGRIGKTAKKLAFFLFYYF